MTIAWINQPVLPLNLIDDVKIRGRGRGRGNSLPLDDSPGFVMCGRDCVLLEPDHRRCLNCQQNRCSWVVEVATDSFWFELENAEGFMKLGLQIGKFISVMGLALFGLSSCIPDCMSDFLSRGDLRTWIFFLVS